MARGIDHGTIFRADTDRQSLVDDLRRTVVDGGATVYAWSLLPNHFHLLIRTGPTPLSLLMRRLLTAHAVRFNRRYQRGGHLFQNRFKSTLIHDETYFFELVRYIHLNPLRAGVVSTIDELDLYQWTGHRLLMTDSGPSWQAVEDVLTRYGTDRAAARIAYRRFVADGIGRTDFRFESGGSVRRGSRWELVTGWPRAREARVPAERVLAPPSGLADLDMALPPPPVHLSRPHGIDPSVLVERVTRQLGITAELVAGAGRHRSITAARTLLAHLLVRRCGFSFNQAARALGMSKWSVRRATQRTDAGREPPALDALLAEIEPVVDGEATASFPAASQGAPDSAVD